MSSQQRIAAVFFAGAVLIIAASIFSATGFSKAVATVDGEKISADAFKKALSIRIGMHKVRGVPAGNDLLRRAVLNELIDNVLILREAKKRGFSVTDNEVGAVVASLKKEFPAGNFEKQLKEQGMTQEDFVKRLRNDMISEKFERSLVDMDSVTEEDLKRLYDSGTRPITTAERTRLRLIEFKEKGRAEGVLADMRAKSIPFDKMAETLKNNSDESVTVSFAGWVQLDVFSPQVADAVRNIKKGAYGGPIKGKDGWYIIKVEDRTEAKAASFEEAKEQLRIIALEMKQRNALQRWIDNQRTSAKITINEKAL